MGSAHNNTNSYSRAARYLLSVNRCCGSAKELSMYCATPKSPRVAEFCTQIEENLRTGRGNNENVFTKLGKIYAKLNNDRGANVDFIDHFVQAVSSNVTWGNKHSRR